MELTISNSLDIISNFNLNLNNLNINLIKPNKKKFPIIDIGYRILRKYNDSGKILFTVLNERLVNSYLRGEIKYGEIVTYLIKAFNNNKIIKKSKFKVKNKTQILNLIKYARKIKL